MSDQDFLFARTLEGFGERVAVVTSAGEHLTYSDLAARADALGAPLAGARRLVAVECANQIDSLVAYLAALRGGHPVLLMAPQAANRDEVLQTYDPDFVFEANGPNGQWTARNSQQKALHADLAVLLSTSGTTGSAKLVRLSARAVEANARSISQYLELGPGARAITALPFHYSYGLSVVNSYLRSGATLVLTEASVIQPEFWALVDREAVTSLAGVPYTFELMERGGFRAASHPSLKTLTQAGGRLAPDLVSAYADWAETNGARLFIMYGQTEATARMAYLPPEQIARRPASIGVAIPEGRFRLVDEAGVEVTGPDAIGELIYAGPNVMMGYALNAADLARGQEFSELATGDVARRDAEGFYQIVGRKSRFAKLFGLRVSLEDVEAKVRNEGFVSAAASSDDEIMAIGVVGEGDIARLRAVLSDTYKLPGDVFQIERFDELPRLASGKVDYPGILKSGRAAVRLAATSEHGKDLAAAFERAFKRPAAESDSFVSLGGDSLNYVVLSLEVEASLGFLPADWQDISLAELRGLARPPQAAKSTLFRPIDSEILVRALAILAVVTIHVSRLQVAGGAHVLLMLAGYNLARYQKPRLVEGAGPQVLAAFVTRIILPYYVLLVAYLLLKRNFDITSLLMVGNYTDRRGSLIEPFWFLEALLQCMIAITVIMSFRPARAAAARNSWTFGLMLLATGVAAKIAIAPLHSGNLLNRAADSVFFLLALGWCAQQASTMRRRIIVTVLILGFSVLDIIDVPLWPHLPAAINISDALWLTIAPLLIVWMPRILVPRVLHGVISTIAAASFYIYLSHVLPVYVVFWALGEKSVLLNLLLAVALGVATWWVVQRLDLGWAGMRTRLKQLHSRS